MGQTNLEEKKIQNLLDRYLKLCPAAESKSHLDEDFLNSFVEGRLSPPEASFVLKHLSRCSFCLHVTTELIRLEYEFTAEKSPVETEAAQNPAKISEVLSGLLSKIFGASDGAVFAHQEDKEESKKDD